jgi:biopolymer transport protein ExbD
MRKRPSSGSELDLLPVMNLVTILIPMLLMGATVVNLSVIDTTLPAITDPDRIPDEPGLRLTVAITDQGLGLKSAAGGVEASEDLQLPCHAQPCGVDGYDYDGLTDALARIKDEHPDESSLILLPEERVPYEVLVKVMDAAREHQGQRTAQGEARSLFPQVVMAGGAT